MYALFLWAQRIITTNYKQMITQEQLKETEERKLALRRYL